jgi:hypothetical protein
MKCGCEPDGTRTTLADGERPLCSTHNTTELAPEGYQRPHLGSRNAVCECCGKEERSSFSLAKFRHLENRHYDLFDCGCKGWD